MRYLHIKLSDEPRIRHFPLAPGHNHLFSSMGVFVDSRIGALVHNGYVKALRAGVVCYDMMWIDDEPSALDAPDWVDRAGVASFEFPARSAKVFRWGHPVPKSAPVPLVQEHSLWTTRTQNEAALLTEFRLQGVACPQLGLYEPRTFDRQPLGLKIGNAQGGQGRNPFPGWEDPALHVVRFDAIVERFFGMALAEDGTPAKWEDLGGPDIDYVQGGGPMQRHVQLPNLYTLINHYDQRVEPKYFNQGRMRGTDPIWTWEDFDDQHLVNFESVVYAAAYISNCPLAKMVHSALIGALDLAWTEDEVVMAMHTGNRGTSCYGRALGWMALAHARMYTDNGVGAAYKRGLQRGMTRGGFYQVWPASVVGMSPDPWRSPGFKISRSKMVSQSIEQGIMLVAAWAMGEMRAFKRGADAWLFNPYLGSGAPPHFIVTGRNGVALDEVDEGVGYGGYADSFTPWWVLGLLLHDSASVPRQARRVVIRMMTLPPPGESKLATTVDELLDRLITSPHTEHTNVAVGALEKTKGTVWRSGNLW